MTYIDTLGQQAKVAGRQIAKLSTAAKNDLLNQVAKALVAESAYIITENAKDMANAKENGISEIMQDRLLLTELLRVSVRWQIFRTQSVKWFVAIRIWMVSKSFKSVFLWVLSL